MCYFTPTQWGCGHITYTELPCTHAKEYKARGLTCPYNTTLGTLHRNNKCGQYPQCSNAGDGTLVVAHGLPTVRPEETAAKMVLF